MSSESDSDDDIKIKQFLEAADTTLLNDSLFQKSEKESSPLFQKSEKESSAENKSDTKKENKKDPPKSQRYVEEVNKNSATDYNLPESMQNHLAKKLTEILKQQYEFYEVSEKYNLDSKNNKFKSRVKLLKSDDCYVKPYEEFKDEIKGPVKKPIIKRRLVDTPTSKDCKTDEKYKSVAVDGNYILSGAEVKLWAKKKKSNDKVFYYKMSSHGVLHAKEEINEFTELRRKNKWNESKIKNYKINMKKNTA